MSTTKTKTIAIDDDIAVFEYNGLHHRTRAHYDTDLDGDVGASDTDDFFYAYTPEWQLVARFEQTDSAPTEEWLAHNAGADGRGGSSYIDDLILRDRDTTGNGTLDERSYFCQNWRHDVVAAGDGHRQAARAGALRALRRPDRRSAHARPGLRWRLRQHR